MFTQCPQCGSYFRIRSEHLDAAGGQVRCSLCTNTFDALERLHTRVPGQTEDPDAVAEPEEIEPTETAEEPVGDLFETHQPSNPPLEEAPSPTFEKEDPAAAETKSEALDDAAREPLRGDFVPAPESAENAAPLFPHSRETVAAAETSPDELGADKPLSDWDETEPSGPDGIRWPWVVGCLVLLLLLGGQMLHFDREHWMQRDDIGPWLQSLYTQLGQAPTEQRDLDQLEISRSNVTAQPGRPGELQVTGLVSNTADFEQPVPAVFLRLEDRWGDTVGSGFFEPEDWVSGRPAPERFDPGQRLAMRLELADPEDRAAGFHLELCWPDEEAYRCRAPLTP